MPISIGITLDQDTSDNRTSVLTRVRENCWQTVRPGRIRQESIFILRVRSVNYLQLLVTNCYVPGTVTYEVHGKLIRINPSAIVVIPVIVTIERDLMKKKPKLTKPGIVEKIIASPIPGEPEKAQIIVE